MNVSVAINIPPGCAIRRTDLDISDEKFYKLVRKGYFVQPAFSSVWIRTGKVEPQWVSAGQEANVALLTEIKPGRKAYENGNVIIIRPAFKCIAIASDYHKPGEEFEFEEPEHIYATWYDSLRTINDKDAIIYTIEFLNKIIKKYRQRLKILGVDGKKIGQFTREGKRLLEETKSKVRYYIPAKDVEKLVITIKKFEESLKNDLYLPTLGCDSNQEKYKWMKLIKEELNTRVLRKEEILRTYPIPEYIDEILEELKPKQPYHNCYTFLDVPSESEVTNAIRRLKK